MRQVKFLFDEHVNPAVSNAIRRLGADVVTAGEAGLLRAPDTAYRELAKSSGRVIVTHDQGFLRWHQTEPQHPGVAYCRMNSRTIRTIISSLQNLWEHSQPDDMVGMVRYL